jgi:hypothetical protein
MNRKKFGERAERADGIRSRQVILDAASKLAPLSAAPAPRSDAVR